jgi:4-hydroxythreonine-4-phosphate dehydrogenase
MTAPVSPVLALTMGEPAGIGGEVTLKAWARRAGLDPFFVIDDPGRLEDLARRTGPEVPIRAIAAASEAAGVFATALPVLPADRVSPLPAPVVAGRPDVANAKAVIAAIETAVRLVMNGEADAAVTNPIQKQVLYQADFPHPGHTEFLAALAGIDAPPVMMLAADTFRVVPVTIHLSLRDALDSLDTGTITQAGLITAAALRQDFGIPHPRLAVAGLNPHAGEDGAMGTEETDIIAPAIDALRDAGIDAFGPVPPDSLFTRQARTGYDAAICMYHDQALIPIKSIAFEDAVNITLGLPFVRTSPDHGTALDIAGTGVADESSLLAALKTAGAMARRRAAATS